MAALRGHGGRGGRRAWARPPAGGVRLRWRAPSWGGSARSKFGRARLLCPGTELERGGERERVMERVREREERERGFRERESGRERIEEREKRDFKGWREAVGFD